MQGDTVIHPGMAEGNQITLVTGATGFIGRHLCERLQREGEFVRACGRREQAGPWQEFMEIDLAGDPIDPQLLGGVSTVFHLASKAHSFGDPPDSAGEYAELIVEGTRRLVAAAVKAGVRTFVYLSSVKVMGEGNPENLPLRPMDEDWPYRPVTPYGCAKAEAEAILLQSGIIHKIVLRPVMVFGPGNKGNLVRMRDAIARGKFPPVPETGNRRSMIHVDDVVEYAIRSAQFPIANGKTYILASLDPVSTRSLYDWMRESLGLPARNWSIPVWVLTAAATAGSFLRKTTGLRVPLDRDTLAKLTGSAWYSSERVRKQLAYAPRHEVRDWLFDSAARRS